MGRFRIKLSERKEYETKSKTKRDGGHEFSPLSRPGTFCHGRFYRPGKLGIQHCRRIGLRLRASVDGHPVHDHADFSAAQCGASRHCHGKVPLGGGELLSACVAEKHDSCDGDDGSGGDRNGGDPRRCDCAPDAVRHSDQARQHDDSRAGSDL